MVGASQMIFVEGRKLVLGTWQGFFFVSLMDRGRGRFLCGWKSRRVEFEEIRGCAKAHLYNVWPGEEIENQLGLDALASGQAGRSGAAPLPGRDGAIPGRVLEFC